MIDAMTASLLMTDGELVIFLDEVQRMATWRDGGLAQDEIAAVMSRSVMPSER